MSMHKTHAHMADLNAALIAHRLPHDKPSQLADGFRLGYLAATAAQAEALAAARRDALEEAAQIVEKATNRSRWVHAVMNSTVTAPCEIAAAIRATLTPPTHPAAAPKEE